MGSRQSKRMSQITKIFIVRLGKLLAHLRGVVPTFHTDDISSQGLGYSYALSTIEDPRRAMTQLRNFGQRGHALSQGRNYMTMEDIPLLINVVFSTASKERVRIFELLIEHKGKLKTSIITASLNTSSIDNGKKNNGRIQCSGFL